MSVATYNRIGQCEGKRTYTHAGAKRAVRDIMSGRGGPQKDRVKLDYYHCPHCRWYHVGHKVAAPCS